MNELVYRELFLEVQPRLIGKSVRASWSPVRRALYLLRPEVRLPLSLDKYVTPCATADDVKDTWRIAAFILETSPSAAGIWLGWGGHTEVRAPNEQWLFLGYDVCDETLVSGLSNCGYSSDDAPAYRREWANRINDYHLFDGSDDACLFATASNGRVPEHAPFYVYGVYRVVNLA